MLEFVLFLNYFIDIVFAVEISSKFGDLSFIFLDPQLLIFQFFFQFNNSLILFNLSSGLFLLLTLLLFLGDFIHLSSKFFELPFEFDMLFDKFSFAE